MTNRCIALSLAWAILILPFSVGQADNIDLVTLPKRDTVQLTIYNTEDLTLARETRHITLKKGHNQLQFSWAGTLIDPTSVQLRLLAHEDEIEILDTVFPGKKPQLLIWNIDSEFEGQLPVEVSYFTSGLSWTMDYVAVADAEEAKLRFRGYVRVLNRSGEDYANAEVRLIVGKINLVEKIATLAKRTGKLVPEASTLEFKKMRQYSARRSFANAGAKYDDAKDAPDPASKNKAIIKEGVSEYFMFSVEGTETVRNGWSKRMQAVEADDVKLDIVYRIRTYQYGPRPVRFFLWANDDEHHLGRSPLPNGIVRIFRRSPKDELSILGQQLLRYVPVKAKVEVNLGADDLVVYQRQRVKTARLNFVFNRNRNVSGWDERQTWTDRIRNYRSKPIRFELRAQFPGDVEFMAQRKTTLFDYRTTNIEIPVASRSESLYSYQVTIHHGANAKQNRILLK